MMHRKLLILLLALLMLLLVVCDISQNSEMSTPSTQEISDKVRRSLQRSAMSAPHFVIPKRRNKAPSSGSPRGQGAPEAVCSNPTCAGEK